MLSTVESLQAVSLFSGLSKQEVAALSEAAIVRTYPKNTIVVTEGERSDSLYVILSGRVKVVVSDENGKDLVSTSRGRASISVSSRSTKDRGRHRLRRWKRAGWR